MAITEIREVPGPANARVAAPKTRVLEAPGQNNALALETTKWLDKRVESRYPTGDAVEVQILEKDSCFRVEATMVDVSRSGLRIVTVAGIPKGTHVEIVSPRRLAIFGEVRYCRRVDGLYHQGILIENVIRAHPLREQHIPDDILSLYLIGKGLTMPEIIGMKEHLLECAACQVRLGETDAILNPVKRRKRL